MAEEKEKGSPIFKDFVFAIVLSKDLTRDIALSLKDSLEDHEGQVLSIGGSIHVEKTTHIISQTIDFPEYADAKQYLIPVINKNWTMASLRRNKADHFRPYSPDPKNIFSDVVITCADIPAGDKDAIIGAVLALGGQESNALTRLTTHLCALTVDHVKCLQALEKNLKVKILLPHWFDDCLKLGKRIDEAPYLLPAPELLHMRPEDPLPIPPSDRMQGATTAMPVTIPVPIARHLTVFQGKKIMLSEDLSLGGHQKKVLEDLIVAGGGSVTCTVHDAHIFISHYRDGRDYVFASRVGVDVGNLAWLYHLIVNNEWTSPLRRLLHYPVPRNGIPGFEKMRITLSNYGGDARTYLENLVMATGAEFTKSMKQDNTHLITARKASEKCQAAEEWNIEMINHLWIEESYAKCTPQKLSDPRYNHFPPRTNLTEIIGQTSFDPKVLEETYFSKSPTPSPSDPKPTRRPIMHEKDKNKPGPRQRASRKESKNDLNGASEDIEMDTETAVIPIPASPKRKARNSLLAQVSTPASRKSIGGKENGTPSTGSRSAKAAAASRIHEMGPDIALYEKENKRKGTVWGGERAAKQIDKRRSLERSSSPITKEVVEGDYSSEEEARPAKKHKSGPPEIHIRLLITNYKRWVGENSKEDQEKRKLRDLGILVTADATHFTHLAASHIVRTKKFLCALASAPVIISTDFIDACLEKKKLPKIEDFLLKDPENEKKFGVELKDALSRAKGNKKRLLAGVPVFSTEKVPNLDVYKEIVATNGGTFAVYRGRPTIKQIKPEDDDGPAEPVYLISGDAKSERELWPKFMEMAKQGNMIPRIVVTDWLLDVAMAQKLTWDKNYLIEKRQGRE